MSSSAFTVITDLLQAAVFPAVTALLFAVITLMTLWLMGIENVEKGEPLAIRPKFPFIGHMVGMLWYNNDYFTIMRKRYSGPIYTLKIFGARIYIIQSPDLAQAAFSQSKEIDFDEIKAQASCKALGLSSPVTKIVHQKSWSGEGCYMDTLHHEMYASMSKGKRSLLGMNAQMLNYLAKSLNNIQTTATRKDLFVWLRDEYTIGSAEALYGPRNPISDNHKFIQAVWDFEKDLGPLALNVFPGITAPKGHAARLLLAPFFEKYYQDGLDKNAAGLIKARQRAAQQWGLPTKEVSKAEISIVMAAGTNTVPNVFYMLCYIYHQPQLVESLREEVRKITTRMSHAGGDILQLDITKLESHCPLLTASFHETLRLTKTGASMRKVLKDVLLDGKYYLKKGAFIQIPTGVIQSDCQSWGSDAHEFKPRRFLTQADLPKAEKKVQTQAFIPFGGGKNLCPGRHFAFTEIVAFVAMMVLGFDMTMDDGSAMTVPEGKFQRLGVASVSPKADPSVLIRRREEFAGVEWEFYVGDA